jgi:hypothetical protein
MGSCGTGDLVAGVFPVTELIQLISLALTPAPPLPAATLSAETKMRLTKAIRASRANGALSRGPKTIEGRRRSSLNATRHGLLAKGVVLRNESAENFAALLAQHIAKLDPADDVEQCAIEEMVSSVWRIRRLWGIEKSLFNEEIDKSTATDEWARIAAAFHTLADGPDLPLLDRYEGRLHRMYKRAFQNFLLLRNLPNENNQTNLDSDKPIEIKVIDPSL